MTDQASDPASNPRITAPLDLMEPVVRGDETFKSVALRKPYAPELRGLKFSDVLQSDADTMYTLLPRITLPPLTQEEVEHLDPADIAALSGTVVGFFLNAAQRASVKKLPKI